MKIFKYLLLFTILNCNFLSQAIISLDNRLLESATNDKFDDIWQVIAISQTYSTQYSLNVNAVDKFGNTALMIACAKGYIHCVKALLYVKADLDKQNKNKDTAISLAAQNNRKEVVSLLLFGQDSEIKIPMLNINLNLQDKNGDTALIIAASKGYLDILHLLLQKRVMQSMLNNKDSLNLNIQNKNQNTALMEAIENKHEVIIVQLLLRKADPNIRNKYNETPLIQAAFKGLDIAVSFLLREKIDVNAEQKPGVSALYWSIYTRNKAITKLLIQAGADTSFKNLANEIIKADLKEKLKNN